MDAFHLKLPRVSPKLVLPPSPISPGTVGSGQDGSGSVNFSTISWRPRTPSTPELNPLSQFKECYPLTPPPEDCQLPPLRDLPRVPAPAAAPLSPPSSSCSSSSCQSGNQPDVSFAQILLEAPRQVLLHTVPTIRTNPVAPAAVLDPRSVKDNSLTGILAAGFRLPELLVSMYEVVEELGSGGFGVVVRAIRREDGYQVAIKLMWKHKMPKESWVPVRGWDEAEPELCYQVPKEAYVLKIMQHPGIVAFEDLFEDQHFVYLLMEYFGSPWNFESLAPPTPPPQAANIMQRVVATRQMGKLVSPANLPRRDSMPTLSPPPRPLPLRRASCDLFECLERHEYLPEHRAKYVFKQIVDSVHYLHARGIVHCDLKDENIVIDASFRVKLIDFGSALLLDPNHPAPFQEKFRGTVNFASPEILRGEVYRAPHAEVWALGCILSVLLTGKTPFPDSDSAKKAQIAIPAVPLSKNAFSLMMGCLCLHPDSRLNIAEIQTHPWFSEE